MPEVFACPCEEVAGREGSRMTLTPIDSTHLDGYSYDPKIETLVIRFKNADLWSYAYVHEDLYNAFLRSSSMGSFFTKRIKPACPGTLISKGTLAERVEIWLRSEHALDFAGYWCATDGKNVLGYSEFEADLREQYKGDEGVMIVKVEKQSNAAS
jgi:hypothetical protein